jgi:uncharacterized YccA/Bax inhibitor family protein
VANKVLEKTLNNVSSEDLRAGYAAPGQVAQDAFGNSVNPPVDFTGTADAMSVTGSARAALVLFAIVVASGTWAWTSVPESSYGLVLIGGMILSLVFGLITTFKPQVARITGPLYALAIGAALGAISKIYEDAYNGIVFQAILATGSIVFVMYTLYSTRILKVTERFRKVVIGATLGIMVFYMITIVMSLFGGTMPLVWDSGLMGIGFSLFVIIIAASNLALDFDFIERGSQAGLPKYMNWAAGYGLIVTIVWIYLEVLRLLAKTRN